MKSSALLLLSLAIAGCAPPYSAELNSSSRLADQMTLLGTFGPLKSPEGDSTTAMKFFPMKPTSASTIGTLQAGTGFLVSQSSGRESLSFMFEDSSGNIQISDFKQGFSVAGADPNYPLYEYDVLATTTTANILVFRLDGTSASINSVQLFTASLPSGPFQSASVTPNPQPLRNIFATASAVLAAHVFPVSTSSDNFSFFFYNGIDDSEGTASLAASGSVFATGTPGATPFSLSAAGNRLLYYRNLSTSVGSYYTGTQWVCYEWDPISPSPVIMPGVTHRIDAVLTNGDLISTERAMLRIYDTSGSEVLSVGLGALQFCYEAYVGATPYVFFTLTLDFPRNNWAFRVYAIRTSELRGLKD